MKQSSSIINLERALYMEICISTEQPCEYYISQPLKVRKGIMEKVDKSLIKSALIDFLKSPNESANMLAEALKVANKDFHLFDRKKHLKFYNSICAIDRMECNVGGKEFKNAMQVKDGKFIIIQEILDLF